MEIIKQFRLMDDDFFRACFQDDIEGAEFILRIIMGKDNLKVIQSKSQHYAKNLRGHSVILDVFATDSDGVRYNIEVQRDDKGAAAKRARYNSSMIDAQLLLPAEEYTVLPESYVIFITENDVLKKGLPIYHIDRTIEETGEKFGDGSHIIYVNGEYIDNSALGKLMHDFRCINPNDMLYPFLKEKTIYLKENTKGVTHMCKLMEDFLNEVRIETRAEVKEEIAEARAEAAEAKAKAAEARAEAAEARAEAAEARAKAKATEANNRNLAMKNAIRMLKDGLTVDKVSEYTNLPIDEVKELADLIAG